MKRGPRKKFLRRVGGFGEVPWRQRKGLVALVILGGVTLLVLLAAIFGEQGVLRVGQLNAERAELEKRLASLEEETMILRSHVLGMQTDPFLYEKAARERLGLVHPGEVVYDFRADPLMEP